MRWSKIGSENQQKNEKKLREIKTLCLCNEIIPEFGDLRKLIIKDFKTFLSIFSITQGSSQGFSTFL